MSAKPNSLPAMALLLSDARGIYIPRDFVSGFDLTRWQGIKADNVEVLTDPEHESYWEAWEEVLNHATFNENGHVWRLYQDGDLWAFCTELMTDEEKRNWGFDVEEN